MTSENPPKSYFVIFRAWNGNNTFMPNLHDNLKNAKEAGVNASQVMLYVQPCGGQDGRQQIQQLFSNLNDEEKKMFSRVWIMVETNPNNGCILSN